MRLTNDRGNPEVMSTAYYEADEIDHIGALPPLLARAALRRSIPLSRHHVIAWKIIQEFWNTAEDRKDKKVQEGLARLLRGAGSIDDIPQKEMCWSTRNLIIGPRTDCRLFDPGDDLDFEIPFGMSEGRQKHVNAMVKLGGLLKDYHKDFAKTTVAVTDDWKASYRETLMQCAHLDDICSFVRTEWTLATHGVAEWQVAHTGGFEVKKFTEGLWHRGCYSPSAVARHWQPGMSEPEKTRKTEKLKKMTHRSYVRSMAEET